MVVEEALAIVEQILEPERLTKVQKMVFCYAWDDKSYGEIAKAEGYSVGYIKDAGSGLWQCLSAKAGEQVSKLSLRSAVARLASQNSVKTDQIVTSAPTRRCDWGEAIDVSIFHGRTQEIDTLRQWVEHDHCRLLTLLGMGGVGKTSLSIKLAEEVQSQFEFLIWRSLRDVPTIDELLTTLIQFLSPQQDTPIPDSSSGKLSRVIELLKRSRCLIILDNFDALLQSGECTGTYCIGCEMYGELLKRIGEIAHQSCVILTTREKPQEVATQEGDRLPVRTLPLAGLDLTAGQQILDAKGLSGAAADLEQLVTHYRGNPLALKMAATSIQDLFAGDIVQFLEQGTAAFNSMGRLLRQQCDRLAPVEQSVMNWLAINREPVSLSSLQTDLVTELPRSSLIAVLESLCWRSLIESSAIGFTQQPVVMEFVTDSLVERMADEIVTEHLQVFLSHAILKTQVKDYIRESQMRVIVQPLIDRLLNQLGSPKQLTHKLGHILSNLRSDLASQSSYAAGNLLNLYRQLETDLTSYDFSRLNIRQAYLQDVSLYQVNFTAARFVDCAFAATFGGVTSVAFSPNGQQLATSDTNGSIHIWSVANGKQLAACNGHNSWVWSVTFSPTQPILASCGQDHQVRLWDCHTGQCLKVLEGHTGIVTSVAFSPDPQFLLSTSGDQTIRLWNIATGDRVQTFQGHAACVWSVVVHADRKTLFSGGEDNVIRVWDLQSGQCLQTFVGHQHWVRSVALSPDGCWLASASFDQTLKLWNITTGECVATLSGHHKPITAVAFSPDGQALASSSYDQTVKLWSIAAERCLQTFQKHTNAVWSVAFHPTQPLLVSGGEDYTTRFWDLNTGCIKTIQGHSNSIYTIALNPNDSLLASGHEDQTIKLWDFDSAATSTVQPFRTLRGHTGRIFSVAFSPDGQEVASASSDRTIKLWNPHTGQCLQTLHGHTSWVWAIAFHPDGDQLASASYDQTIKLWDVKTGDCLQTLQEHTSSVLAIAFSSNGQWLASGGYEQAIKLWNPKTGACLNTWQAHLNRVWAVVFSPDNRCLATGGDDRTIKLWDISTGECLQTFEGHSSQVLSLLFSADGSTLFSSSADRTIRVWNMTNGACQAVLQSHQNWVWSLAQTQKDEILLSGSQDETIQSWNIDTGASIKTLRSPRPYEGTVITDAIGLTQAQTETLKALGAIVD